MTDPHDGTLPPPPPGLLVRSFVGDMIWHEVPDGSGQWATQIGGMERREPWPRLAAAYGGLELLVAVPYRHHTARAPKAQELAEAVLGPAAAMMRQLAEAAGHAVASVIETAVATGNGDVERRVLAECQRAAAAAVARPGTQPATAVLDAIDNVRRVAGGHPPIVAAAPDGDW